MPNRLKEFFNRLARAERGSVLVISGIAMAALLGFSALVVDIGMLYLEKSNLQNALDASALAGVQELPDQTGAVSVAKEYFVTNGYKADDLLVTFTGDDTITCESSATVQTTFARVFGVNSTNTTEMHATALHTERNIRGPFGYGVFQGMPGEQLELGGAAFTVNGGVFSNGTFKSMPGGDTYIEGLETVSGTDPDILGCVNIGTVVKDAEPIEMIDMKYYFDGLRDDAMRGHTFTVATSEQVNTWPQPLDGYITIQGDYSPSAACIITGVVHVTGNLITKGGVSVASGGTLIVDGNLSWGGYSGNEPIFDDALVYVGGSISAGPGKVGTTFFGYNNIYAGGNIYLGGGGIYTTESTFFYTQNGDLTVSANCNSIYLAGILYAYNGAVVLESKPNIYGAVIGNYIDSFPGGLTITYPTEGLGLSATEDAYRLID